jgi:hypothetical protein
VAVTQVMAVEQVVAQAVIQALVVVVVVAIILHETAMAFVIFIITTRLIMLKFAYKRGAKKVVVERIMWSLIKIQCLSNRQKDNKLSLMSTHISNNKI